MRWVPMCVALSGCIQVMPIPEDFDAAEASFYAELSLSAYDMLDADEAGEAWAPPEGVTLQGTHTTGQNWNNGGNGTQDVRVGWVGVQDDTILVVYRGTTTTTEALLDLASAQVDYPLLSGDGGGTHEGFTERYIELHPGILQDVEVLLATTEATRVVTTGHSLGGAVATLSAATLAEAVDVPVLSYTFASPRVGDRDFVARYVDLVAETWRVTNPYDLVPGFPEEAPFAADTEFGQLFYEHVPTRVDLVFDAEDNGPEGNIGVGGNHSSCRYMQEVCELAFEEAACVARMRSHRSCAED